MTDLQQTRAALEDLWEQIETATSWEAINSLSQEMTELTHKMRELSA